MSHVRDDDNVEGRSKSPSPRLIITVVLAVVALVFVFQNSTSREINFLLWDMSAPTWLWMLILLAVGVVIGSVFPWGRRKKKDGVTEPVTFVAAQRDAEPYDEFALVVDNAAEMGITAERILPAERGSMVLASGQTLSYLRWGESPAEVIFLHGGGQNAHTWDSVVIGLGRPAVAVDLPGHGRSDRRSDGEYLPWETAAALAEMLDALAGDVVARRVAVVGMSMGGMATISLAASRPDRVAKAVIVDVTPAVIEEGRVMTPEQRGTVALISGPPTYDSFEEVVAATAAAAPGRPEPAIRRGVRHNMYRMADGRWRWRYDFGQRSEEQRDDDRRRAPGSIARLWDDVAATTVPVMLVVGGNSVFVQPEDVEEYLRRAPSVRVETVAGSGHAVQSDAPQALVALLAEFVG